MKFFEKYESRGRTWYSGRKNGFTFDVCPRNGGWYCTAVHAKKDISYNTLWDGLEFKSLADAQSWCETTTVTDCKCLGI